MERNEFLKILGAGSLLVCAGCLDSCSSKAVDPAPTNVDFTLDLTASENAALNTVGGSLSRNKIIIARISSTEFSALYQACSHEGTAVNYQSSQQNFLCPAHQSKFDKNGNVLNGPAGSPLRKYNAELTGNSLHIFS